MSRPSSTKPKLILITGAGGYLGLNIVNLFAKEAHKLRVSVRNKNDKAKTEIIQNAAKGIKQPIEFVEADLLNAESWNKALEGVK
jgi:uncharacterized protein YbjT (DUF2867 family)